MAALSRHSFSIRPYEEKCFKNFSSETSQTIYRFYVKTMSADGGHFGPRSGSLSTFLAVDHLRTIDVMFAILFDWFQRIEPMGKLFKSLLL
jgi:hypothetical protein